MRDIRRIYKKINDEFEERSEKIHNMILFVFLLFFGTVLGYYWAYTNLTSYYTTKINILQQQIDNLQEKDPVKEKPSIVRFL